VRIGVFALQGDVSDHVLIIEQLGHKPVMVRNPEDLATIDCIVVPGGESTTFGKLASRNGLDKELISKVNSGMPIFGTCAGLIMMANEIEGYKDQPTWKLMNVTVKRNAYGRQLDSRIESIKVEGMVEVEVAFIRAPYITNIGANVKILSYDRDGNIVFVREDHKLGAAFHPEITKDASIHKYFIDALRRT
jgi:5'-phosphate synthase pdxT subunit